MLAARNLQGIRANMCNICMYRSINGRFDLFGRSGLCCIFRRVVEALLCLSKHPPARLSLARQLWAVLVSLFIFRKLTISGLASLSSSAVSYYQPQLLAATPSHFELPALGVHPMERCPLLTLGKTDGDMTVVSHRLVRTSSLCARHTSTPMYVYSECVRVRPAREQRPALWPRDLNYSPDTPTIMFALMQARHYLGVLSACGWLDRNCPYVGVWYASTPKHTHTHDTPVTRANDASLRAFPPMSPNGRAISRLVQSFSYLHGRGWGGGRAVRRYAPGSILPHPPTGRRLLDGHDYRNPQWRRQAYRQR